jgi:hypothetical protein
MVPPPNSTSRISDRDDTDLPEPDSPDDADGLARAHLERDILDADDRAALGLEFDAKVPDLHDRPV